MKISTKSQIGTEQKSAKFRDVIGIFHQNIVPNVYEVDLRPIILAENSFFKIFYFKV